MKVINLGDRSSVINSYMAQLRDVNIQETAPSSAATWSA